MPALTFARAVQVHQLARQGASLALMVAVAKAGLSLEEVGNFEALRYVAYVTTVFWLGSLGTAFLRARQETAYPQRWFTFYLLLVALGALATFAVFALFLPQVTRLLLDLEEAAFGVSFGVYLLGVLVGSTVEQEAIADQATDRLLGYSLSSYGLQTVLFVAPLALGMPLYVAMLGLAASAVYRLAWVGSRYLRTTDIAPPATSELRAFGRSAGSLSIYTVGAAAVVMVDHALVTYGSPDPAAALALWRYGAQELPLLLGIVVALNVTSLAEMTGDWRGALADLRRRTRRVALGFFALAIVLVATSSTWFGWAFSPELAPGHVLFNTLLLIVPSRLVLTTPQLVRLDLEPLMARTGLLENVLNVIVSLALLPSLGLLGIAVGTVVAYSFERCVYVVLLWRRGIAPREYLDVRVWLAGSGALVLAYALATDFSQLAS